MKKTRLGIGILGLIGLLASGCETVLDWPVPIIPKLTIISHLSPGSWEDQRIFVYTSLSPLDSSQFESPFGISLEITELDTDTKLQLDSVRVGNKVSFELPEGFIKSGFSYSIKAEAPGFTPVHAVTRIPQPSTISNLEIRDVHIQPSEKNEFKEIVRYQVVFNINHFQSNRYYHLIFYNSYIGSNLRFFIDPELSDEQPFLNHYAYGVLIDREDLEENKELVFNFVDWMLEDQAINRIYVELRTISEDYFKYHSTLARQLIVRQDPFAEPVPIYNNIDGGYGNFSGYSPNVISSDLPE